jgi:hypothetical protein
MAFANTGLVSLCTIFSKTFPPGDHDLVKMLEDDLADLTSKRSGRQPSTKRTVGISQQLIIGTSARRVITVGS